MKKIMFVLASILLMVLAVASASAEVTLKQVSLSHFDDAKVINFEDNQWESKGVSFKDISGKTSVILVNDYNRGGAKTASGEFSLFSNGNYPETSANVPLTITFEKGMSAVGFYLGNGNQYGEQVSGVVTAYGKSGKVLGMIAQNKVNDAVDSFLGLQAPAEAIYKVTIDYGNSLLGEEIDDLMFVNWIDEQNNVCNDPDGNNLKTKSWVEGWSTENNKVVKWSDYCTQTITGAETLTGKYIHEAVCKNGEVKYNNPVKCEEGFSCNQGACVKETITSVPTKVAPTCSDTDGGNDIYEKGILEVYTPTWGNQVVHEYCADENRKNAYSGDYLEELVCLKNDNTYAYEHKQVKCQYGCENGACKEKQEVAVPVPVAGSCTDRVILKGGNSLNFEDGVIANVGQGDFYFLDRTSSKDGVKFWANNLGQQGIVDLGVTTSNLKEVTVHNYDVIGFNQDKKGFYRFGVPVVQGHTYAVLINKGVSVFKVLKTDGINLEIEYLTSKCSKKTTEKIYLYNKNNINGVELEWNDLAGLGIDFDKYNVQWIASTWDKPANSYISFGSYYNLKNLQVGETFDFKVCPSKDKKVVGLCSNTITVKIKGDNLPVNLPVGIKLEDIQVEKIQVEDVQQEITIPVASVCETGCSYDSKCLPIGTRIKSRQGPLYCNWEGSMLPQQVTGAVCENSFECGTNSCLSGQCNDLQRELSVQRGMLERIISWLNKLF